MRTVPIVFISVICLLFSVRGNAQQSPEKQRHVAMIKFLVNQKELTNLQDTIPSNLDVMYDRSILQRPTSSKLGLIYIFGSLSPHGRRFIGLTDKTGINLLETKDLSEELPVILHFLSKNNVSSKQTYKCLTLIAETYQYNSKRNFRSIPEVK